MDGYSEGRLLRNNMAVPSISQEASSSVQTIRDGQTDTKIDRQTDTHTHKRTPTQRNTYQWTIFPRRPCLWRRFPVRQRGVAPGCAALLRTLASVMTKERKATDPKESQRRRSSATCLRPSSSRPTPMDIARLKCVDCLQLFMCSL